jgi:hypothetical protein
MASPDRNFANSAIFTQTASGTTPNAGDNSLYFKSDSNLYSKNSSGTETQITRNNITPNSQSASYILQLSDAGKYINISTGGVTVPSGIFASGDVISIYNNSASSQTITQDSGVTMYLAGTPTIGNRTLAQRGVATILCVGSNTFTVIGGGLS